MRFTATPQANPVRLDRPRGAPWRVALLRLLRGDSHARRAARPVPPTAAGLAQALVAAPAFTFPIAPAHVVDADASLNFIRRAIAAHDDGSGYDARDIARREEIVRNRMPDAWRDLQGAARRFLSVVEAHEAGR